MGFLFFLMLNKTILWNQLNCYRGQHLSYHSSALVVLLIICLHNLFQESQGQTKIALDQKWVVLFEYEVHFAIRPKLSLNAPFLYFFGKINFFLKKGAFKAKIIARDMMKLCYKLCHCEV